jgi:hypothetical protein
MDSCFRGFDNSSFGVFNWSFRFQTISWPRNEENSERLHCLWGAPIEELLKKLNLKLTTRPLLGWNGCQRSPALHLTSSTSIVEDTINLSPRYQESASQEFFSDSSMWSCSILGSFIRFSCFVAATHEQRQLLSLLPQSSAHVQH